MPMTSIVLAVIVGLIVGALIIYMVMNSKANGKVKSAHEQADKLIHEAEQQANEIKKDAQAQSKESMLAAKEEILKQKQLAEEEEKQRNQDIRERENRVSQREASLDRRSNTLDKREEQISSQQSSIDKKHNEVNRILNQTQNELERVAAMTSDEAREKLLNDVKESVTVKSAAIIRDAEQRTKQEADKTARKIVSLAIQRVASDQANDITVTSVHIPSDELKGRIIGREGRNIRTFEQLTGVNLIIDDTPETVVLSSFDPVRREIARVALENLISDGRIHPARIEEMFNKATETVNEQIQEAGDQAAFDANIHDLHPELIKILGRLRYRTSYGQNVLKHSLEVANLAAIMASELGLDEKIAKRAGLLHDIGKAVDHEIEGSHAVIGGDICRRYKENPIVTNAVEAHHNDVEPQSEYAYLVMAADAMSAARPGARRESAENYIKRLEKLEEISNSHDGVERTYAMQAGREIRVMVRPEDISDAQAVVLAHDIAHQIEDEMEYPGQVKVTVIRESRATDYAK
ncbi:MAG: ribonuclease Y [Coriobacteriia bacterium]|nr:ribonuclease Y [Coriobacteriia bacterium]